MEYISQTPADAEDNYTMTWRDQDGNTVITKHNLIMNKNIEEVNRKRDITGIRVVQGLCLAFILLIEYTMIYESTPSNYVSDSFMFMTVMLVAIIVVLEFCKEIKYSVEEVVEEVDELRCENTYDNDLFG